MECPILFSATPPPTFLFCSEATVIEYEFNKWTNKFSLKFYSIVNLWLIYVSYFFFPVIFMREDDFSDRLNQRANFSGFTPLHYAALSDSHECVRRLIDAGKLLIISINFPQTG